MNRTWLALAAPLSLLGCETPVDDDDSVADDDSGPVDESLDLTDANNYSYTNAISIASQDVEIGQDFEIDFSALTVDIQLHDMDPAEDIDGASLIYFPILSQEEVEAAISEDSLTQPDTQYFYLWTNPGTETGFMATEYEIVGNSFVPDEVFTSEEGTWLARLTTGTTLTRMVTFVQPSTTTTNRLLTIGNDSAAIDFDPDLEGLSSIELAGEPASYVAGWSAVTTNGLGNAFNADLVTEVMIGRYEGFTLADLEADFFDLEVNAAEIYYAPVSQSTSADLTTATDAGGAGFTAFGPESLWLLALRCNGCVNPAPPFLTVIHVTG